MEYAVIYVRSLRWHMMLECCAWQMKPMERILFGGGLPVSAMAAGADMASVSMHKSGGSLTQSSLLLTGPAVHAGYVRQIINLTQTTSGSYLLMSSLDIFFALNESPQLLNNLVLYPLIHDTHLTLMIHLTLSLQLLNVLDKPLYILRSQTYASLDGISLL